MVRIKGVNSDYEYSIKTHQIQEVDPLPSPVHMKIFVCPNDAPSRIDQREETKCCEGFSNSCPGEQKSGHAAIALHEKNGVTLSADHGQFTLDQQGNLLLEHHDQQTAVLKIEAQGFELQMSNGAKLTCDAQGNLKLAAAPNQTVTIDGRLELNGKLGSSFQSLIAPLVTAEVQKQQQHRQ